MWPWNRPQSRVQSPPPPPRSAPASPQSFTPYFPATLDHWRASDPHRLYAKQLFETDRFRELLAVLHNARPSVVVTRCDPTEAAILLGIRQGFDHLLSCIALLAEPLPTPPEQPEPTYGAENFDINQT